MTRLIQAISQAIQSFVQKIVSRLNQQMDLLRDLVGNLLNLHPEYEGLVFTIEEEAAISKSADLLKHFFLEPPGATLVSEDFESRCEAIEDLAEQLKVLYGLEDHEIIITDDPRDFGEEEGVITRGKFDCPGKRVYINAACLRSDDEDVLNHVIITILHEMRHGMQHRIATGDRRFDVPYQRRRVWRENIANYIPPDYDYEGYFKQPIEFDARTFANRVWNQAYYG